jgi:hypothetical protein
MSRSEDARRTLRNEDVRGGPPLRVFRPLVGVTAGTLGGDRETSSSAKLSAVEDDSSPPSLQGSRCDLGVDGVPCSLTILEDLGLLVLLLLVLLA